MIFSHLSTAMSAFLEGETPLATPLAYNPLNADQAGFTISGALTSDGATPIVTEGIFLGFQEVGIYADTLRQVVLSAAGGTPDVNPWILQFQDEGNINWLSGEDETILGGTFAPDGGTHTGTPVFAAATRPKTTGSFVVVNDGVNPKTFWANNGDNETPDWKMVASLDVVEAALAAHSEEIDPHGDRAYIDSIASGKSPITYTAEKHRRTGNILSSVEPENPVFASIRSDFSDGFYKLPASSNFPIHLKNEHASTMEVRMSDETTVVMSLPTMRTAILSWDGAAWKYFLLPAASGTAATQAEISAEENARIAVDLLKANLTTTPGFSEVSGLQYWDHRGLPNVYPEETMEAYRASVAAGAEYVEIDCFLLADGSLGVMHDTTLTRTTTSTANSADQTAASWTRLVVDAGTFLGSGWGNYTAPLAEDVIREFGNKAKLIVEAKNTGAGAAIVAMLDKYGISKDHVIINSFIPAELTAAISAGYLTSINYASYAGSPTPASLASTGYDWVAVTSSVSQAQRTALKAAGLNVAVYTLNRFSEVAAVAVDTDAIYTNDGIYLRGLARRTTDPFASQTWYHGHLADTANGAWAGRGTFTAPNKFGFNLAAGTTFGAALMGWASPMGGAGGNLNSVVIDFSFTFTTAFDTARAGIIGITTTDHAIVDDIAGSSNNNGYDIFFRKNGEVAIARWDAGVYTNLGATAGTLISDGATATYRITITATHVTLARTDVATSISVADATYRGRYLHAGTKGVNGAFSGMAITFP